MVDLIKYKTVSATAPHDGEYVKCAAYLQRTLEAFLPKVRQTSPTSRVFLLDSSPSHSPVVVFKWVGTSPDLPVVLLNCHYDVVPAGVLTEWADPPFSGAVKGGKVYGRGAQDMKCVVAQYVAALRKLAEVGFTPSRTLVLTVVPDEENGGAGMAALLASEFYGVEICRKSGGVAIALDEGLASTAETYSVFYGERLPWWVEVTATGSTGHASRFIEPTAMEQIVGIARKALEFRKGQKDDLFGVGNPHAGCAHAVAASKKKTLGDVTSLNVTTLKAGVDNGDGTYALNVVPPSATASLDIRISPKMDPLEMKGLLDGWCKECSVGEETTGGLTWKFVGDGNDVMTHSTTSTGPANPFYKAFEEGVGLSGIRVTPDVFPAATDSRFLRALGIRALGFSPMRRSEMLLHDYNECLGVDVFTEGCDVYVRLIRHLGMVQELEEEKKK